MNYETLHTDFFTTLRTELVNAGIEDTNGDTVSILATYNDERDDLPAVSIQPINPAETFNKFDSYKSQQDITINVAITVQAKTTLDLDTIVQDIKNNLPDNIEDATYDSLEVTYSFTPANNRKIHESVISVAYRHR